MANKAHQYSLDEARELISNEFAIIEKEQAKWEKE